MDLETRCLIGSNGLEFRMEGETPVISGYAAVFYDGTPETEFRLYGNVFERVMPGAFDTLLTSRANVVALFNHEEGQVLGSIASGSLQLSVDARGLKYRNVIDLDTSVGRDVAGFVKRGDVKGSSFAFRPRGRDGERWTEDDEEREIRELVDVDVRDVGPATFPAYAASTVMAERSLKAWRSAGGPPAAGDVDERRQREIALRSRMLDL